MPETLQLRVHGDPRRLTVVYLPGIHGDWTLIPSLRLALKHRVRFVEITYPRTLTWSLDEYAAAVEQALREQGIAAGWVLAESFGSQVGWALLDRLVVRPDPSVGFRPLGLILAGGFVTHPMKWGVRMARFATSALPMRGLRAVLVVYARVARFRHRHAPETLASIGEFVARRTELDRQAAIHRLDLIHAADFRPVAQQVHLPVFALTGFLDPIVPWCAVHPWLRRHCPGFRARRVVFPADHNVLGTAPHPAAAQILAWLGVRSTS